MEHPSKFREILQNNVKITGKTCQRAKFVKNYSSVWNCNGRHGLHPKGRGLPGPFNSLVT